MFGFSKSNGGKNKLDWNGPLGVSDVTTTKETHPKGAEAVHINLTTVQLTEANRQSLKKAIGEFIVLGGDMLNLEQLFTDNLLEGLEGLKETNGLPNQLKGNHFLHHTGQHLYSSSEKIKNPYYIPFFIRLLDKTTGNQIVELIVYKLHESLKEVMSEKGLSLHAMLTKETILYTDIDVVIERLKTDIQKLAQEKTLVSGSVLAKALEYGSFTNIKMTPFVARGY
ncbi:MAG: hypothetical protein WCJ84_05225 [Candidatus Peregrinibacteria bacterium]